MDFFSPFKGLYYQKLALEKADRNTKVVITILFNIYIIICTKITTCSGAEKTHKDN
jgi:hypothetical protein